MAAPTLSHYPNTGLAHGAVSGPVPHLGGTSTVSQSQSQVPTGSNRIQSETERQHLLHLANIVRKNLEHQADWSGLTMHSSRTFPRPLISGIPPEAIYQSGGIAGEKDEGGPVVGNVSRKGSTPKEEVLAKVEVAEAEAEGTIEWVLPIDLREKWSLRKWAEAFDSIPASEDSQSTQQKEVKKRLVMAIVASDSTVVYYIVHDGIVKPRQN